MDDDTKNQSAAAVLEEDDADNKPTSTRPADSVSKRRVSKIGVSNNPDPDGTLRITVIAEGGGKEEFLPCTPGVYRRVEEERINMVVGKDFDLTVKNGIVSNIEIKDRKPSMPGFGVRDIDNPESTKRASQGLVLLRRDADTEDVTVEEAPPWVSPQLKEELTALLRNNPTIRAGRLLGGRYLVKHVSQSENYDEFEVYPRPA